MSKFFSRSLRLLASSFKDPLKNILSTANAKVRLQTAHASSTYLHLIRLRRPSPFSLEPLHFRYRNYVFQRVLIIVVLLSTSTLSTFAKGKVPRTLLGQSPAVTSSSDYPGDYASASTTVKILSHRYAPIGGTVSETLGSGTLIREDGIILTNNHIVQDYYEDAYDAFEVCLTFDTEKDPYCGYTASLVAQEKNLDLALLKLNSRDIFDETLPALSFLDPFTNAAPKNGDTLTIYGYPGAGLDSITTTQGQVSGFSEENGVNYIKTDTEISSGNSGGTAVNSTGQFIGIPTSEMEGLGYLIDIRSAADFIQNNIEKTASTHAQAEKLLRADLATFILARRNGMYTRTDAPNFTVKSPEGWEFALYEKNQIQLTKTASDEAAMLYIAVTPLPFLLNDAYLEKIFEQIDTYKDWATEYDRIESTFQGYPAYKITIAMYSGETTILIIPLDYSVLTLTYAASSDMAKEIGDAETFVSNTVSILGKDDSAEKIDTITIADPAFSMSRAGDFSISPNPMPSLDQYLVFEFAREDSADGEIKVSYYPLYPSDRTLTTEALYDNAIRDARDSDYFSLISSSLVTLDGLSGYALTTTYAGEDTDVMKESAITLRDGDFYYSIVYTDLDKDFDAHEAHFRDILMSFRDLRRSERGEFALDALNYLYSDIAHHRYENEITQLHGQGYLEMFDGSTFDPEKRVTRIEALRLLIDAKMTYDEKKKNLGKKDAELRDSVTAFSNDASDGVNFSDTNRGGAYTEYVRYARSKGYVGGYSDQKFRPYARITLAEALSLLFRIFEMPTWQGGASVPWHKPLMDKAFQMGIMPFELTDAHHRVTRGELTYILKWFLDGIE